MMPTRQSIRRVWTTATGARITRCAPVGKKLYGVRATHLRATQIMTPVAHMNTSTRCMLPRSKNPTPRVVIVREDDEKRPTSVKASDRGDDDPAQNDQAPASQSGDEGEGSSASGSSGHDGDNNNNNHDDDSKGEGKGSLLLSRNSVPSVYPQVLALPITRRPLFPGFYKAVVIRNPHVCAAIKDAMKRGQPYLSLIHI